MSEKNCLSTPSRIVQKFPMRFLTTIGKPGLQPKWGLCSTYKAHAVLLYYNVGLRRNI